MATVVTQGQDFVVTHRDRGYGGRTRDVLVIDGDDGNVKYATDVSITGSLSVNGQKITGGGGGSGGGGILYQETLGRPLKLSSPPLGDVLLYVNGQMQRSTDYACTSDGYVMWRCLDFSITPDDQVDVAYQAST
jgi:hypothetical protein